MATKKVPETDPRRGPEGVVPTHQPGPESPEKEVPAPVPPEQAPAAEWGERHGVGKIIEQGGKTAGQAKDPETK
jgi:hypothetical protein